MKYDKTRRNEQCKTPACPRSVAACACSLLFCAVLIAKGQGQRQTGLDGSLISRQGIALDAATGDAYVVDTQNNAIVAIHGRTHTTTTVKVGANPVALCIDAVTHRIYVANHGSGTVSVLDGASDQVIATIDVGSLPYVIAVNAVTNKIYVSNVYSTQLTMIDGATNITTAMKAVSADAMAVDDLRNRLYLMGYEDSRLAVLDAATGNIRKLPLGVTHQWGLAIEPVRGSVYVTRIGNADLVALDERTGEAVTMPTGRYPCAIAIDAAADRAYVANYADDSVTVIDLKTHAPIATVKTGQQPQAIAVDEERHIIYVANRHGNSVTVIDGGSSRVIDTVPAGKNPYAVVADSRSGLAYAADSGDPAYTEIDIHRASAGH